MVHEIVEQSLSLLAESGIFSGDEDAEYECNIAVRNGFDSAKDRSSTQLVQATIQAESTLESTTFPKPAPRSLRAVGFIMGVFILHSEKLVENQSLREKIILSANKAIRCFPDWPELDQTMLRLIEENI